MYLLCYITYYCVSSVFRIFIALVDNIAYISVCILTWLIFVLRFYIKAVEAELPILPSEITAVCGLNNQQFIRQAFLAQILQLAIHHFRAGWLPPFASV